MGLSRQGAKRRKRQRGHQEVDPQGRSVKTLRYASLGALVGDAPSDFRRDQVKVTFLAGQDKPVPSLVFHSCFCLPDRALFERFYQAGVRYANDAFQSWCFGAFPEEIERFVQHLRQHPSLGVHRALPSSPFFSFTICRSSRTCAMGFETVISETEYAALIACLAATFTTGVGGDLVARWSRMVAPA